ncbi:hypothetical protein [Streptomyces gardneri]|uniref:hypothetical protein n=1 Tax=Streptomyces gardneri TaxID=66892 RepID=UPI003673EE3B
MATAWQLNSLVRWLATQAIDGRDPDAEANRFLALYQHAEATGDRTSRAPVATRASLLVRFGHRLGSGVLLQDGTVLTHAYLLAEDAIRNSAAWLSSRRAASSMEQRVPGGEQRPRLAHE